MSDEPTLSKGDTVIVRNTYGWWRVEELHLVRDEITVRRGSLRRTVPAADVQPVREGGTK
jgi:hypothetical protein